MIDLDRIAVPESHRLLAAALEGDATALERCAEELDPEEVQARHTLGPALAIRAGRVGLGGDAVALWRRSLALATARFMLLERERREAAEVLAAAGVPWVPLKGMDLAFRVFPRPEDRPAFDVDLLIAADDYARGRQALERAGWESLFPGAAADRWITEEGYVWAAVRGGSGPLLEVHTRLWGLAPEEMAADLLAEARPDPSLPPGGRRLTLAQAFVVAAVHGWLDPPPRPLLRWWDLARIAATAGEGLAAAVPPLARRWEVELPVSLAAALTATLWTDAACADIARALAADLRPAERRVARRAARHGLDAVGLEALSLARLLAGRRSRMGWKAVWRRIWAHPGALSPGAPPDWSPAARRVYHFLESMHLRRTANWFKERREASGGVPGQR